MHIAIADPTIALRAGALCRSEPVRLPTRLCRLLVQAWVNRLERRIERAVTRLGRAGLLDDAGQSRHRND
jgi:hypothetical protein